MPSVSRRDLLRTTLASATVGIPGCETPGSDASGPAPVSGNVLRIPASGKKTPTATYAAIDWEDGGSLLLEGGSGFTLTEVDS